MSKHARILIAEDNVPFANAEAASLTAKGFDVTVAYDGLEALAHAHQDQFDLVLTDYDMPGIKGADLCRRLRQSSRYAQTPIILMTCFGRDLDIPGLQDELQLSAILDKPFRSSELVNAITECLADVRNRLTEEDADLDDLICNVEALGASVQSAIRRVSITDKVRVVSGVLEGIEGMVIALRAAGRILIRLMEGVFVEVCQNCVRTVD